MSLYETHIKQGIISGSFTKSESEPVHLSFHLSTRTMIPTNGHKTSSCHPSAAKHPRTHKRESQNPVDWMQDWIQLSSVRFSNKNGFHAAFCNGILTILL